MKVMGKASSLLSNLCQCTDRRDSTKSTQSLSIDKARNCSSSIELRARSYDGTEERPGTSCERFHDIIQMTEIETPAVRQQDRWQQIDRIRSKSACSICDFLVPTSSTSRENKYFGVTCSHQKKRRNQLEIHSAGCSEQSTPSPLNDPRGLEFDFHPPSQSPRFLNLPTPPRSRLSSPSPFSEKDFGFPQISDDSLSLPEIEVRHIDREELHLPRINNLSLHSHEVGIENLRIRLRSSRRHSLAPLHRSNFA